jgi:hypothetical protein
MLLSTCLLLQAAPAMAQSSSSTKTEIAAIQRGKNALVSSFDKSLPKVTLAFFLKTEGKGAPIRWEVNDCGEQSGNLADARSDYPMCVEADMTLKDGRTVTLFVAVGTAKRGVIGKPVLFDGSFTDQNGTVHTLRRLSDLPVELNHPKPNRRETCHHLKQRIRRSSHHGNAP